jgi:predicted nucleic acid-binding protein
VRNNAIVDTGPIVAFFDRSERYHQWSCEQFKQLDSPLITSEPVITEAMFLLRGFPAAQEKLLTLVSKRLLLVEFSIQEEIDALLAVWKRYRNVPASLADVSLIRIAESADLPICTLDSDFSVYRKESGGILKVVHPQFS